MLIWKFNSIVFGLFGIVKTFPTMDSIRYFPVYQVVCIAELLAVFYDSL